MEWFTWESIIGSVKIFLQICGAIALVITVLTGLFALVPKLSSLKADFFYWVQNKYRFRKFKKAAIKNDIENVVNNIVFSLQDELPYGWIRRAKIEWVPDITNEKIFTNEVILRIRPIENQDANLVVGVYSFFNNSLFPKVKEVIPSPARKAAVLLITKRAICSKRRFLEERFNEEVLEAAVQDDADITKYYPRYHKIDKKGFFTGAFLREVYEVCTRERFGQLRGQMEEEMHNILSHMEHFIENIPGHNITSNSWSRIGPATSYGFLLVAHPTADRSRVYVARAKERLDQGIERLYVFGTSEQLKFARFVISEIAKIDGYKLQEKFSVHKDYRGTSKGIGALFVRRTRG